MKKWLGNGSQAARALRRKAEKRLRERAPAAPGKAIDSTELLHDLQVHEIELQMQNEALTAARAEVEAALARFTRLYDFAPVGYYTLQDSGIISSANLAGARLLDVPRAKLLRRHFASFIAPADQPRFAGFIDAVFAQPGQHTCEVVMLPTARHDGLIAHIEATQDAEAHECRLVVTDITETKHNEARLKLAASVFTHAQEGIMIMDANGIIIDVNRSFCAISGLERETAVGTRAKCTGSTISDPDFQDHLWRDLEARGQWAGEIQATRANGEGYVATLKITAVSDAAGVPQHYVVLLSDITAVKEQQHRLERLAHYDALTGLPNRVLLSDRLSHAMAQARRRGNFMALAYLDLDGFKAINDTFGHKVGDELLVVIAQRLKEALREGDTVARLGGDEFVAVLADLSSKSECDVVLSRMLNAASTPVHIGNNTLAVSASLGVTLSPQDPGDADILLRHADLAMYQAKQAGKNRYHLFDPELDRHAKIHYESLRRIALALDRGEFLLHYQPIVNMRTGSVVGAEALIRWHHPERGLLIPADFLLDANDQEIVSRVGDWVLDAALDQMAVWQRGGLEFTLSVNIAAHHLQQEDFVPRLREKLRSHPNVRPGNLKLEVLETAAFSDNPGVTSTINACQELGVEFSLDDFGTGYSSLTYLKRLPAATLKIDLSFVRDMLWDTEDLAIVEGVIGLALAFNRQVIAEGAETFEHARLLLRLGCDMVQGNGISPPLPAAAIPGWVAGWRPEPEWSGVLDMKLDHNDLPLIYAEVNHRQWFRQLEALLVENSDFVPIAASDQCPFYRWYSQEGAARFGYLAEFRTIGVIHERLHALGREMIASHLGNGSEHGKAVPPPPEGLSALRDLHRELIDHMQILSAAIFRAAVQGITCDMTNVAE